MVSALQRALGRKVSRALLSERFYSHKVELPFQELALKTPENGHRRYLRPYYRNRIFFDQEYPCDKSDPSFPLERLKPLFQEMDLVMINLETPLTSRTRAQGYFISDPAYAWAMKEAGVGLVCLANNHTFDAGEAGFLETLEHLDRAGILQTGAGMSIDEVRAGRTMTVKGSRLCFLSYTQYCSQRYSSIAADYPGILPMDRLLMAEDIQRARARADLVLVSLHWGQEYVPNVHPAQIEIARGLVDAGADAVIGHHSHIPQAIEIYRGRPILYSLGNLIFGSAPRGYQSDSMLVELLIRNKAVVGLVVHPVSSQRFEAFQPYPLQGRRARALLEELLIKSLRFGTTIGLKEDTGVIAIDHFQRDGATDAH
jgi:poly-gamma-glutamate capsule biosynthesis protein CapA/YwtB (metallophosphatase superfamily)